MIFSFPAWIWNLKAKLKGNEVMGILPYRNCRRCLYPSNVLRDGDRSRWADSAACVTSMPVIETGLAAKPFLGPGRSRGENGMETNPSFASKFRGRSTGLGSNLIRWLGGRPPNQRQGASESMPFYKQIKRKGAGNLVPSSSALHLRNFPILKRPTSSQTSHPPRAHERPQTKIYLFICIDIFSIVHTIKINKISGEISWWPPAPHPTNTPAKIKEYHISFIMCTIFLFVNLGEFIIKFKIREQDFALNQLPTFCVAFVWLIG